MRIKRLSGRQRNTVPTVSLIDDEARKPQADTVRFPCMGQVKSHVLDKCNGFWVEK